MSANFWTSSHYQHWTLERSALQFKPEDLKVLTIPEIQKLKIFYISLAQTLGKELALRQQVIATAIVYFKRFYTRNAFRSFDGVLVVVTCIYLACKVEECTLVGGATGLAEKVKQVVGNENSLVKFPYSPKEIYELEFYFLEDLDCYLIIYHPYRPLKLLCSEPPLAAYLQTSWGLVNDTYWTDASLLYPPHMIAIACIYMAVVFQDGAIEMPNNNNNKEALKNWFADLNVNMEEIVDITQEIICYFKIYEEYKTVLKNDPKSLEEILRKGRPPFK